MPGVLVLEALAQASAILAYSATGFDPSQKVTYLMAIDGAKFRKPVVPGDRLDLEVEVVRFKGVDLKTRGVATVDGAVVAEGEFLATVVDKDAEMSAVHPTAIVTPGRSCIPPVEVGPYAVIGPQVEIGAGTTVGPARGDRGAHHASASATGSSSSPRWAPMPQDLKYAGEDTALVIGDENHDPRVHHPAHGNRRRRRRHPHRQRQSLHGLQPRGPRLPGRERVRPGQRRDPRPATSRSGTTSSSAASRRCTSSPASGSTPSSPAARWW